MTSQDMRVEKKKTTTKRLNILFFMYSYFAENPQDWTGYSMTSISFLITLLAFFSFSMTFYFSATIKTEAVTVTPPKVIRSYQDILENKQVHPMFLKLFDEYLSFKSADKTSVKGQVWKRVNEKGIKNCLFDLNHVDHLPKVIRMFNEQTAVLVLSSDAIHAYRYVMMALFRGSKNRALVTYDPIERSHLRTYLTRSFPFQS